MLPGGWGPPFTTPVLGAFPLHAREPMVCELLQGGGPGSGSEAPWGLAELWVGELGRGGGGGRGGDRGPFWAQLLTETRCVREWVWVALPGGGSAVHLQAESLGQAQPQEMLWFWPRAAPRRHRGPADLPAWSARALPGGHVGWGSGFITKPGRFTAQFSSCMSHIMMSNLSSASTEGNN